MAVIILSSPLWSPQSGTGIVSVAGIITWLLPYWRMPLFLLEESPPFLTMSLLPQTGKLVIK